jgi:hypothetical protein
MINFVLAFMIGCTTTYLVTVISSGLVASTVLEKANLTYALLLMSAYEISIQQLEKAIVAGKIPDNQAAVLRRTNNDEFERFANKKINEVLKLIPASHLNIIRYKNFNEMKVYVTQQYRSNYAQSKQKR